MSERLIGILVDALPQLLLAGLKFTLPLTVLSFTLAVILALILALVQVANVKGLKQFARFYIWIFRGTPLIVQMFIIFFGLPSIGVTLPAFPSAVIAFSLNYAAYMAELFRSSIMAISKGQWEAASMIGLTYTQTMVRVVLPQAFRIAFPTMFNSLIGLTKDTSLASCITIVELFTKAQHISARVFEPFALYCEAALIYLCVCTILTFVQNRLEKKMVFDKPRLPKKAKNTVLQSQQ